MPLLNLLFALLRKNKCLMFLWILSVHIWSWVHEWKRFCKSLYLVLGCFGGRRCSLAMVRCSHLCRFLLVLWWSFYFNILHQNLLMTHHILLIHHQKTIDVLKVIHYLQHHLAELPNLSFSFKQQLFPFSSPIAYPK